MFLKSSRSIDKNCLLCRIGQRAGKFEKKMTNLTKEKTVSPIPGQFAVPASDLSLNLAYAWYK